MTNTVELMGPQPGLVPQPKADSLLALIERVVSSPDIDVAKMKELLELRERWERNEARKAFVAAMNAFKTDPPTIVKNRLVAFKDVRYNHATLDHVCDAVIAGLSKHGISHRWKPEQRDGQIVVTCVLTHELGHSEETTLAGPPDNSGSKNSLQAIGSTVSYLERYTLLAATGLAATDQDNDGTSAGTNGELQEQLEWIANAKNSEELKKLYKAAYKQFEAVPAALKAIIAAKDKKLEEWR